MSSSENEQEASRPKYKTKRKVFCQKWLEDTRFKEWLKPITSDVYKCKCECCNKVLTCGKIQLIRHAQSTFHQKRINCIKQNKQVDKLIAINDTERKKAMIHKTNVQKLELGLAFYFAEHNVAIHTVDHLVELLKKNIPDSRIVQDMELKRTKCTSLIRSVIAKVETDEVIEILKTQTFSVLCDESTDISMSKQLCILVRYVNGCHKTVTQLLEICHVDATDASAVKIYQVFKECLQSKNIPLNNIVGLACDGANVMIGEKNSFFSHLKNDVPHIILLKCICHSAALVASKACLQLPRGPEDLMRQIATYVSGSSKKCAQLAEIQEFLQEQQLKILKPSATRWLSLHQCVSRILQNWEALKLYFEVAAFEDKLLAADTILKQLNDQCIKCYFLFLNYSLNFMNSFNALFQSNRILIQDLQRLSLKLYTEICQNFIKGTVLSATYGDKYLDIIHPHNYVPLFEIYTGTECEILLKSLPENVQHDFRLRILEFYVTLAKEIINRLPLVNDMFKEMEFLKPEHVFNKNRTVLKDLNVLPAKYKKFLDESAIGLEWRILPFAFDDLEINRLTNMPLDIMWQEIKNFKDFTGSFKFKNIGELASIVLTLPHSNAEAERIFSMMTDVKTKKRNRLGDDTLNAICMVRSSFSAKNINCSNFETNEKHFSKCNKNIYK